MKFSTVSTLKKIAALLFCSCLFVFSSLKAEIVYTDFEPDEFVSAPPNSGRNFQLDFNSDNNPEFMFQVDNLSDNYQSVNISGSYWGNQVIVDGDTNTAENFYPLALDEGFDINPENDIMWFNVWDLEWGHSIPFAICGYGMNGPGHWADNPKNKYLGVRFIIDNDVHYGWVAIEIPNKYSLKVKGFAYETIPNKSIKAGETSSSSVINKTNDFILSISPNPATDFISINLQNDFYGNISVINIFGEVISELKSIDKQNNSILLNLGSLPGGVYFISAVSSEEKQTEKFVLTRK